MVDLSTPLTRVVGARSANPLAKHRDVVTVGDLLEFWPRRYRDRTSDLSNLHPGEFAVVVARVKQATTRTMKTRRGRMLNVVITDGTNDLALTFFKAHGHEQALVPGTIALFAGEVGRFGSTPELTHPAYKVLPTEEAGDVGEELIPIYLRVPGMQTWTVAQVVRIVLDQLDEVPDPIPPAIRLRRGLPNRLEGLRRLHLPRTRSEARRAEQRFRYEEAFVIQAVLARRRLTSEAQRTSARVPRPGGLLEAFDRRLPFALTSGQQSVSAEIAADLAREHPMHRLLQGEVGSGKTVVALRAMLTVIDSGGQAALLAPTEVLAGQHFRSITTMLGDLAEGGLLGGSEIGTKVVLLTGSQPAATRRRSLLDAASGEAGIVVGTHALIQEHVQFADLGLVVVDEQHRFGVEQRDALRAKGAEPPHVLVMTATPIPRTVAMTVFGDMETSTLTELPPGRSPIASHVVPGNNPRWVQRTWERVGEEVRAGHRAYVVCPRIGGSEGQVAGSVDVVDEEELGVDDADDTPGRPAPRPAHSVLDTIEELRANPALDGLRISALHGRMSTDDKDATMRAFAAGEIDVLVATTVIEVGVDVPAATVMVIMDADRFGVSQLHQLRGRVGRGTAPGLCLLMTDAEPGPALERLEAVAASADGFALARLDLEQRKEGDVLGARQSGGRSQLRLLRLLRDEDLILQAREDAFALVAEDPRLGRHPVLRSLVASALDEEQAAYLERG